ncbi:hypothetical protein BaRGS_00029241, partial [Batillaria attramentaria]
MSRHLRTRDMSESIGESLGARARVKHVQTCLPSPHESPAACLSLSSADRSDKSCLPLVALLSRVTFSVPNSYQST